MQLINPRITLRSPRVTLRSPRATGRSQGIALGGLALLLTVLSLVAGFAQEPQKTETRSPEDVKAEDAFVRTCVKCHTADRVVGSRRSRTQWEEVMTQMQTARGAIIPDEDWDVVQNYLVKNHGRVNVNRAPVNDLVEVLAVTPETAENIVKYRKEHGDFADFDTFAKVPGLDLEKLERLRDAISF